MAIALSKADNIIWAKEKVTSCLQSLNLQPTEYRSGHGPYKSSYSKLS